MLAADLMTTSCCALLMRRAPLKVYPKESQWLTRLRREHDRTALWARIDKSPLQICDVQSNALRYNRGVV